MASRSSTSSSEIPSAAAGFPWGVAGAVVILLGIEALVRLAPATTMTAYDSGRQEYLAVASYLMGGEAADVGFVGSSMTREGISAPEARAKLEKALGRSVYVANYGCGGLVAAEGNAVVQYMIRNQTMPRLLMYEVGAHHLRPSSASYARLMATFWNMGDWYREWQGNGWARRRDLPVVIRQSIAGHWLTFRYRQKLMAWSKRYLGRGKPVTVPMLGENSTLLAFQASIAKSGRKANLLRNWTATHLKDGRMRPLDQRNVAYLENTLAACRENGIAVVLYEMPLWPAYREKISREDLDEFYEVMETLVKKHGVPFWRMADLGVALTDDCFIDVTHMNRRGARLITEALVEKAIVPQLSGATADSGKTGISVP